LTVERSDDRPNVFHRVVAESYRSPDGRQFQVAVRGAPVGHLWHGWLAFVPHDGGPELTTERETTQPNRPALAYWARGLQPLYLDGAFARASRAKRRRRTWLLEQATEIAARRWSTSTAAPSKD
jgi:hypothetical protein